MPCRTRCCSWRAPTAAARRRGGSRSSTAFSRTAFATCSARARCADGGSPGCRFAATRMTRSPIPSPRRRAPSRNPPGGRSSSRQSGRWDRARQRAPEAAGGPGRAWGRSPTGMPTGGGAAAALVVAVVLWPRQPAGEPQVLEAQHAAEDMDLLADSEALELLDGWDGPFYEWAAAQTDNVQSDG